MRDKDYTRSDSLSEVAKMREEFSSREHRLSRMGDKRDQVYTRGYPINREMHGLINCSGGGATVSGNTIELAQHTHVHIHLGNGDAADQAKQQNLLARLFRTLECTTKKRKVSVDDPAAKKAIIELADAYRTEGKKVIEDNTSLGVNSTTSALPICPHCRAEVLNIQWYLKPIENIPEVRQVVVFMCPECHTILGSQLQFI